MYFVVSAFVFQFISNSILGSEVRLFPMNGDVFPGVDSPVVWKSIVATLIFPIKFVLLKPLDFLFALPDPPPPILVCLKSDPVTLKKSAEINVQVAKILRLVRIFATVSTNKGNRWIVV
ncbi:hypothetical protein [Emticicia fontis]